jgi:lipase chaperone LimK
MSTLLLPKFNKVTILALIASIYFVYFITNKEVDTIQLQEVDSYNLKLPVIKIESNEKTIATVWQWNDSVKTKEEYPLPAFSEAAVFNALHRVRLDYQGNVILDHEALIALNATLDDSRLQLDQQALNELQIIIRQGLPGSAGEVVANIVANYYNYLEASKEFNAIYETDSSNIQAIDNTADEHEENYRELIVLRELYLGSEIAAKLFSTTNANANYMFDTYRVEHNMDLSDDEKQQLFTEILNRHTEQTINVSNWQERYSTFQSAKQVITVSSISDEEKEIQLTELMNQHFNPEELSHVRHFELNKP